MKRHLITKALLGLSLFVAGFLKAQTSTQNYVYSKTCLDADCIKKTEAVQYFDGMGRPKQIVNIKASPAQKDIVGYIEYDQYGRLSKSYLPVPQTGTQNGNIYDNPLSNAAASYGTEKIYSEQIIENSPLERVKQSFGTGTAWAGKPVGYNYDTNTTSTEVKKYTVSTTWAENRTESPLASSGYYPIKKLMKTSVTDEDGNTTIEYKNGKGQTLLIRKNDGTKNVDTYYVYNEYNQLAYVIPPLASVLTTLSSTDINSLCYQYHYDGFGRLVEKKLPGKGWEYLVYDKQDRLVLTQDVNLGAAKKWLFTKYDQFGRVAYTGIYTSAQAYSGAGRAAEQVLVDAKGSNNVARTSSVGFTVNGRGVYYDNNASTSYPNSITSLLGINYYDTYPVYGFNPAFPASILGAPVITDNSTANAVSTKSLPVMSLVKNIEDDNWTSSYVYYDNKGRAIGSHSVNHLGGYTKTETELDFAGVPQKVNTTHLRKQGEIGISINERFVYDPQNRLKQHFHQVDSNPEELLADYTYNELSQLTNKKVGNNLQGIDYTYNVRGWLTDINKDQMGVANLGGKLFAYKIKYNQKQGITNPDTALFSGKNVTAKYDGNIAEIDWRAVETIGQNPSLTPKRYGYAYDKLNRLSAGYYQNPNNPNSKENTESLDYDLNGNISNLYRTSIIESGNTATLIDKLQYQYSGGYNQLTSIVDNSLNPTGYEGGGATIGYDLNGNMTSMPDKGIVTIGYNHLDLSNQLKYNRSEVEEVNINTKYGADGVKLQKETLTTTFGFSGSTTSKKITDYLDGFQYVKIEAPTSGGGSSESLANLETSRALEMQAFSVELMSASASLESKNPDLQFFPTAEGFYDYTKDQYIYQYTDHLGNVRVSFARSSAGDLEITDSNDYYPFGMNHLKTGFSFFGPAAYKNYKFGLKELQEVGFYDFGARQYMSDIGRWFSVDPMAESNPGLTTYRYGFNNPIMFTDPNGMLEKALTDKMWKLGGSWDNTGDGFENDSHIKLGYEGNYLNLNTLIEGQGAEGFGDNVAGEKILPRLNVKGYGTSKTWGSALSTYTLNHNALYNGMLGVQAAWNYANRPIDLMAGVRNDGPVQMIGGMGDPVGIFDVGGQVLSTWKPENRYLAMGIAMVGAVVLKKPGLAKIEVNVVKADAYAGVKEASAYLQQAGVPRLYRKQILESFEIETISLKTAGKSTYGLRFYGGAAKESGRYLFPTFNNYINRVGLALPPSWNSMSGFTQFRVAPGSKYIFGRAASQGGIYTGGSYQMYVNDLTNLTK